MDNATTDTLPKEETPDPAGIKEDAAPDAPKKVKIHFVAVGSAPILKRTKFQIAATERFAAVHVFLRKLLQLNDSSANLFLYCHSAFCPSPDQLIGELRDAFAVREELVIHYSLQEAWG